VAGTSHLDKRAAAPSAPAEAWSRRAVRGGWAIIAAGALLRIRQYAVDRSLWRDEAALVFNILHRGYLGFDHRLAFEQGTPPGFFVIEKAFSQVFGTSEPALRAFPLLCGLGALVVALILVRRHLDAATGLVSLALMAASPSLIYFSSEVKQYSTDVLVALVVLLATSDVWRRRYDRRSCVVLVVVGALAVLCSHAATFVLAGAGVALAVPVLRAGDRTRIVRLAGVGAALLVAWGLVYGLFDRHLDDDTYLRFFWKSAFLPIPPTSHDGLHRWSSALSTLFTMLDGNVVLLIVVAPLAVIGLVRLGRRQPGVLCVLVVPWVAVVVASSRQLYPATERLVLFLVPFLAVVVAAGAVATAEAVSRRGPQLGMAVLAVVVVLCAGVAVHRLAQPQPVEEMRPLYEQLRSLARPGDVVYVSQTAVPSYLYYAGRDGPPAGHVVLGHADFGDAGAVASEVAPLAGHARVWLLTSAYWEPAGHATPVITSALSHLGTQVAVLSRPGSEVVLYDLSRVS
jgi:4-amino-4-deoxy-L-arabinose transferase-like glycosyltransferase